MKETKRTISVDRQALYEEIWGKSLHKTALKYNTTDNKLKEACVAARIPLPTQSYWSKKHMGIDVSSEIMPLPASNESVVEIILKEDRKATNAIQEKSEAKGTVIKSPKVREKKNKEQNKEKSNTKTAKGTKGIIIVSRQELYDIIWKLKNMNETAKQYNIPVTRLTAICEASNIPLPTPSHMGDKYNRWIMKAVPLPESAQVEVKLYTRQADNVGAMKEYQGYIQQIAELNHIKREKPEVTARQVLVNEREGTQEKKKTGDELLVCLLETSTLRSMDDGKRERVFRHAVSMPGKISKRLYPDVINYKQSIETWENATRYDIRKNVPANIKNIAKSSRKRMFTIMNTLAEAMSVYDGKLKDGSLLVIGKDQIGIEFVEGIDKVPHVMTKEETKLMAKYEADQRIKRYSPRPDIPKYDHSHNGLLRVRIGNKYSDDGNRISIGDVKDGIKLEDRMDEILIAIFEKMESYRISREAREERARIEAEEKKRAEERKQRISEEKDKTRELISLARRHKIAMEIREYVSAVREAESPDYNPEWADWALKKADWYDPVIAREDELLGTTVDLKKEKQNYRSYWNG